MAEQGETRFKRRVQEDLYDLPNSHFMKTQEKARKGVPDIFGCVNGQMIVMELKIDGEEPTPLQRLSLERWNKAGAVSFSTTPSQWPTHFAVLKEISEKGVFEES